jgi:hypothetical protein
MNVYDRPALPVGPGNHAIARLKNETTRRHVLILRGCAPSDDSAETSCSSTAHGNS